MPIPKTKSVGSTIRYLKHDKPGMSQKQKVAIALDVARSAGAKIPLKRKKLKRRKKHG